MYLIGTRNIASQDLAIGQALNLGEIYRKYCRKNYYGVKAFDFNGTSISLQHSGIYHITANITFTAPAAGDVTFQLSVNSTPIPGALATETVTTATTEVNTTTIDFFVLVDNNCVLNTPAVSVSNISVLNTGVASTVTNVIFNVEKVV